MSQHSQTCCCHLSGSRSEQCALAPLNDTRWRRYLQLWTSSAPVTGQSLPVAAAAEVKLPAVAAAADTDAGHALAAAHVETLQACSVG